MCAYAFCWRSGGPVLVVGNAIWSWDFHARCYFGDCMRDVMWLW